MKRDSLPVEYRKYFWDIDIHELSVSRDSRFIIERLLEYGDKDAVFWLLHHYPREEIADVVRKSRRLSARSANFWAFFLNISREEVFCLSRSFQKRYRLIWKH